MKKTILFSAMIIISLFVGCSGNNDGEDQKSFKLPECVECTTTSINQFTRMTFCDKGDGTVKYTYCNNAGKCDSRIIEMKSEGASTFEEYMIKQNKDYDCPYIEENLDKLNGN